MSELLPDHLECSRTLTPEDKSERTKPKKRVVTNILEWIKCFSVYIAIIVQRSPKMVPDLLGCQFLIIDTSIQYDSNGWMGYNQWFHLNAAANSKHVPVLMLHYGTGPSLAMPRFSDANTTFALHIHTSKSIGTRSYRCSYFTSTAFQSI